MLLTRHVFILGLSIGAALLSMQAWSADDSNFLDENINLQDVETLRMLNAYQPVANHQQATMQYHLGSNVDIKLSGEESNPLRADTGFSTPKASIVFSFN